MDACGYSCGGGNLMVAITYSIRYLTNHRIMGIRCEMTIQRVQQMVFISNSRQIMRV